MEFFVSSRRQQRASWHLAADRILRCGVVSVLFMLTMAAGAQVAKTGVPDAPSPNSPALHATLFSRPAPYAFDRVSSTPARPLPADAISLYTVVDLALRNSKAVRVAEAEQQRTQGYSRETRDVYIPNFSLGSG